MKSARLRLPHDTSHIGGTAHADIEVTVESIEFSVTPSTAEDQQELYLRATFLFYQVLLDNHDGIQDRLVTHLTHTYDAASIETATDQNGSGGGGVGVRFAMTYDPKRLVTLQCDQSSGELAAKLTECAVTAPVLRTLGVLDVQLGVEITNKA